MRACMGKKPIVSSTVTAVLFLIISRLIGEIWWIFGNGYVSLFAYEAISILLPFLFVLIFGDLKVYKKRGLRKTFTAGGYMAIGQTFLLLMMFLIACVDEETIWETPVGIIYGIVMLFGIGFREESVFRGIIVHNIGKKYIKDRRGIFVTALSSGVIFGLVHMWNVFMGVDFFSALIQSVVAIGAGFYFAAVYLRGGSLWGLIIMHAVTDAASMFPALFTQNGGTPIDAVNNLSILNLTPFFILTMLGMFLLRRKKCDEIIESLKPTE